MIMIATFLVYFCNRFHAQVLLGLRGLHWLGGGGGLGFILYACISAATAPLALPLYPPLCSSYSIQQARQSCMQTLYIFDMNRKPKISDVATDHTQMVLSCHASNIAGETVT